MGELPALRGASTRGPRRAYPALVAEWSLQHYAGELQAARSLAERLEAAGH